MDLREVDSSIHQVALTKHSYLQKTYWITAISAAVFNFLMIYGLFRLMGPIPAALLSAASFGLSWANISRKHLATYLTLVEMHLRNRDLNLTGEEIRERDVRNR